MLSTERAILEQALGLDASATVSRNAFKPTNVTERRVAEQLLAQGLLGLQKGSYHVTAQGLTALGKVRSFTFGVIG